MKIEYGEVEARAARRFGLKPLVASLLLLPPVNAVVRALVRHVLPSKLGSRLPLGVKSVEYKPVTARPIRLLEPNRDLLARDIYWGKGAPVSPADARVLRCVERLSSQGGTFVDVGAYAGVFALLAARSNSALRSIAYEIVPENYVLMVRNVIENDLIRQVECKLLGLAKAPGSICIPSALGFSSNALSISIGSSFQKGVTVPLSTLDLESRNWVGPLIVKIDVEGYELDVLEGGKVTLAQCKPDIVCEILPGPDEGSSERIEALLKPLGYRFFNSVDAGFVERKRLAPDARGRDWLFSARPDIDEIILELQ